jgi:hypothetical protein
MVRIVLASLLVVSVAAITGCGTSTVAVPASNVATRTLTAPPPPPGETTFSFDDAREEKQRSDDSALSFRPNAQERPTRGAVHAAIR